MKFILSTISRQEQRYDTLGDWFTDIDGVHVIRVTEQPQDRRHAWLLMLHEFVEMVLCMQRGISQETVDKWDMEWKGESEPGADASSPYYHEHLFAETLERYLASELGVEWSDYEKALEK